MKFKLLILLCLASLTSLAQVSFNSFSEMRLRKGAQPNFVVTLNVANDPAAGLWKWDATSTAADNNATIIGAFSTGRWVKIPTGDNDASKLQNVAPISVIPGNLPPSKIAQDATNRFITDVLLNKLGGIATGATANDTDANLKNRANHTGTAPPSSIATTSAAQFISAAEKAAALAKQDALGFTPFNQANVTTTLGTSETKVATEKAVRDAYDAQIQAAKDSANSANKTRYMGVGRGLDTLGGLPITDDAYIKSLFSITGNGSYNSATGQFNITGGSSTTDATPTLGSTNPVQSGGVATALAGKQALIVNDLGYGEPGWTPLISPSTHVTAERGITVSNSGQFSGGSSSLTYVQVDQDECRQGVRCNTGITATGYAGTTIGWNNTATAPQFRLGSGRTLVGFGKGNVNAAPSSTDNYDDIRGWIANTAAAPNIFASGVSIQNGAFLRIRYNATSAAVEWQFVTKSNNTETVQVLSGVPSFNTYFTWRIELTSSSAKLFINGSQIGTTQTTNIPSAFIYHCFFDGIVKTAGTNAVFKTNVIDYAYFRNN